MNFTQSESVVRPKDEVKIPTARDLMTRKLISFAPDEDVYKAIDILLKKGISGAPVIERGKLAGMLSEKDCLKVLTHHSLEQMPAGKVGDFMTTIEIKTIPPEMDIFRITDIFLGTRYRRLPVLEDGHVIGQVSRKDVLHAVHRVKKNS